MPTYSWIQYALTKYILLNNTLLFDTEFSRLRSQAMGFWVRLLYFAVEMT
jgi:hypothetical protein